MPASVHVAGMDGGAYGRSGSTLRVLQVGLMGSHPPTVSLLSDKSLTEGRLKRFGHVEHKDDTD